jgi:hypothetical protein
LALGGAGALGSAVVEALLGQGRLACVGVVVVRPTHPAMRALAAVVDDDAGWRAFAPDAAVIVFDRERHANGRDDAFLRPRPAQLLMLAQRLRAAGVKQLVVAVPHAPFMLPQALKAGLASLDEGAVAALGFEHLVFMRLAQAGAARERGHASAPQRLAHWVLRQLHWMVPSDEQPVRAATVARVVARLIVEFRGARAGTRVMPAELLWHAAQSKDAQPLLAQWLAGQALPPMRAASRRW